MSHFVGELKKLGLKDKEASVYLACLELGPSAAQPISRKANVVRATTYVVLESLMQKGLVTRYKEGKKTLFSAEPPRQLVRLLEKREEEIAEHKHELNDLLPELQMITKADGGKPTVRYFEGVEGLRAIRREIVMHTKPGDVVYNFTPKDHLNAVFPDNEESFIAQRLARGIKSKTLYTTKSKKLRDEIVASQYNAKPAELRFVSSEIFPSTSGMTIFGDRIAIGNFKGALMGVVVESAPMAEMMQQLFELAWKGASNGDN